MKASIAELSRISGGLPADIRLYLIAGPDEATAEALGAKLVTAAGPDAERVDMAGSACKDDPAALTTASSSLSLFAAARVIRLSINGAGDECLGAVEALLEADSSDAPVVAVAGSMSNKSKLMKLAEASPHARATVCYQPKRPELIAIAVNVARDQHLRLANAEAAMLVDLVDGDQALMGREIEKLSIYLDAGEGRQRQATPEAIRALGAASHDEDVSEVVNTVLSGKTAGLQPMFARIASAGVNEIRLIRSLAIRVTLLARLRARVESGENPKALVDDKRNGVFWLEKDAVVAQLRIWDATRIARLMSRLLACEHDLKASGTPGGVLFRQLLVDIAHMAARVR